MTDARTYHDAHPVTPRGEFPENGQDQGNVASSLKHAGKYLQRAPPCGKHELQSIGVKPVA
jgi:hypothetical protein